MHKTDRLGIRVSPEDKLLWEKQAYSAGLTLSQWMTKWLGMAVEMENILYYRMSSNGSAKLPE